MKRFILIVFIITILFFIEEANAKFCCREFPDGPYKCWGSGVCCFIDTDNEYWDPLSCVSKFEYYGDLDYFNVLWSIQTDVKIAMECTLYGEATQKCIPYPYVQTSGEGACAVRNPMYEFGDSASGAENNISCKFYDVINPEILSWKNETFKPVAFGLFVTPVAITIGEPFSLPIQVKNLGLLTDNYTVEVTPLLPNVGVEQKYTYLKDVERGETVETRVRLAVLSLQPTPRIKVNVTSSISGFHISKIIEFEGGVASLPEFGLIGILQIMIIAALVVVFIKKT